LVACSPSNEEHAEFFEVGSGLAAMDGLLLARPSGVGLPDEYEGPIV